MKKTLILLAAGAMMFAACDDDFTRPPLVFPPTVEVEPTTTLEQFKIDYWSAVSAATTIDYIPNTEQESVIFTGRVCSSDESGNIYKNIIIQSVDEQGKQVAVTFAVNANDMYETLPFGQEVAVFASGLTVGGYRNLMQFGKLDGGEMTFMDEELFTAHVVRTGKGIPEPELVDTAEVTVAELVAFKGNQDDLRQWQSCLVRVKDVSFEAAGQPFAGSQTTNRYVNDVDGNRLNVRNSSYATFSEEILPSGSGDVVGILSYYSNDWQILLIDQNGLIGFDPVTDTPDTPGEPGPAEGDGTEASPYNTVKALEVASALAADTPTETEYYVKGKVSSIKEIDTGNFGNATYSIISEGTTVSFDIYRGYYLDGAKFTSADQLKVGDEVIVRGKFVNYKGNTPQMAQGGRIVSINGQTGSGDTPDEPGTAEGDGTEASPYNSVKAFEVANALAADTPTETEYYVKGKVSSIKEIDTGSYGNATYSITSEGTSVSFDIFRGYYLDGAKFTSSDQLKVGDEVIVRGKLVNYKGNTPQMAQGSRIISINGQTGSGDTPPTGDENAIYSDLSEDLAELPAGWTIDNVSLADGLSYVWNWKLYNSKGYLNGSAYVDGGAKAAEAYAITPVIDLTGATGCTVSFDHAAKFQTTLKSLCGVCVRVEGTSAWTPLAIPTWPEAGSWTFVNSGAIDLSAYNGKKIQIAFKYGSSTAGADTWEIKNLIVNGKK